MALVDDSHLLFYTLIIRILPHRDGAVPLHAGLQRSPAAVQGRAGWGQCSTPGKQAGHLHEQGGTHASTELPRLEREDEQHEPRPRTGSDAQPTSRPRGILPTSASQQWIPKTATAPYRLSGGRISWWKDVAEPPDAWRQLTNAAATKTSQR